MLKGPRRKVYTGFSSRGLLLSENSLLNIFARFLLGLKTRQRSYTAMRTICVRCYREQLLKRALFPLALGILFLSGCFYSAWHTGYSSTSSCIHTK
jgi:hypothetical protein